MIARKLTLTPPLSDAKLLLLEQDLSELHRQGHSHSITPPTVSTSAGTPGQIAYDSAYLYVCIAQNTWKRIALASF